MKIVLMSLLGMFLLASCQDKTPTPEVTKAESQTEATVPAAEEDCDEKAKKPIEIKEETISLSGNTGCTLE